MLSRQLCATHLLLQALPSSMASHCFYKQSPSPWAAAKPLTFQSPLTFQALGPVPPHHILLLMAPFFSFLLPLTFVSTSAFADSPFLCSFCLHTVTDSRPKCPVGLYTTYSQKDTPILQHIGASLAMQLLRDSTSQWWRGFLGLSPSWNNLYISLKHVPQSLAHKRLVKTNHF